MTRRFGAGLNRRQLLRGFIGGAGAVATATVLRDDASAACALSPAVICAAGTHFAGQSKLAPGTCCEANAECCSNVCNGDACTADVCIEDDGICQGDEFCCSGLCFAGYCGSPGQLDCSTEGQGCEVDDHCCGDMVCNAGFCEPAVSCGQQGAECREPVDCCGDAGLICDGLHCDYPPDNDSESENEIGGVSTLPSTGTGSSFQASSAQMSLEGANARPDVIPPILKDRPPHPCAGKGRDHEVCGDQCCPPSDECCGESCCPWTCVDGNNCCMNVCEDGHCCGPFQVCCGDSCCGSLGEPGFCCNGVCTTVSCTKNPR
jgi:hypothetical protein